MKSLYDKDFRYAAEAEEIERPVFTTLTPIFDKFVKEGYSPREIGSIMHAAINEMELLQVLNYRNPVKT